MTTIYFKNNNPVEADSEEEEIEAAGEDPAQYAEIFFKIKMYLQDNNLTIGDRLFHEDFVNFINTKLK